MDEIMREAINVTQGRNLREITNAWKYLSQFDTLYEGQVQNIPVELVRRNISSEEVEAHKGYLQTVSRPRTGCGCHSFQSLSDGLPRPGRY